ncbi:uncharacterized protein LOC114849928 isoform X2 [Betta splendens]|uniref:Uncharacterized protein LOC114849928 isoform X2 n=1 Tax=Betta splendens TaxID=158456 RepID=A0A9W2XLE7_BETSP|nr:uncharacterized protein LOC114849928 isoform X2 [Betta splendens]
MRGGWFHMRASGSMSGCGTERTQMHSARTREMVGGRTLWLSCLLTSSAVLLLGVSLSDVEASSCHQRTIHKRVGDAVELSTCLSPDESRQLIVARWKKGETEVADKDSHGSKEFSDRFYLNPTNFSLRVRKLTLQDSGKFSFVSEVNNHQLQSVFITLQVHEPITQHPDLQVNSTWNDLNKSCRVLLECSSVYNTNVRYSLSVRNQTHSGSRLQFSIRPEDGETTFTCTIFDFVSEMSAFKTLTCSNSTESLKPPKPFGEHWCCAECSRERLCTNHHYSWLSCGRQSLQMETDGIQPQTVYDRIQLSRVRKPSTPNQEI